MELLIFLFWFVFWLLLYTYVLYPLAMFMAGEKPPALPPASPHELPCIAVLVLVPDAAHLTTEQLATFFDTTYPQDKLSVWVSLPPGTDLELAISPEYRQLHGNLHLVHASPTADVAHLQQQLVDLCDGTVLVFVNAEITFKPHTLAHVAFAYSNPKVGAVQLRMLNIGTVAEQHLEQEIIYTRYDQRIKQGESRFGTVIGAHPACYSIRHELYEPLPRVASIGLHQYLNVLRKGFKTTFAVDAVFSTHVPEGLKPQYEARITEAENNYRSLPRFADFLNPAQYKFASLAFWSHKVLRWYTPHLLAVLLLVTLMLTFVSGVYRGYLWLQVFFYAAAGIDIFLERMGQNWYPLRLIRHFVVINVAQLMGFIRAISGKKRR